MRGSKVEGLRERDSTGLEQAMGRHSVLLEQAEDGHTCALRGVSKRLGRPLTRACYPLVLHGEPYLHLRQRID